MSNKTQKHYKSNKRTYYLNLRSVDAIIDKTSSGNNHKFEWRIKNIDVSRQARMCVTSVFLQNAIDIEGETVISPVTEGMPIIFRCPQVQNLNVFDSANGIGTIFHISNSLHMPVIENWYPLNQNSLDKIEIYVSNVILDNNNGISNTINFYIQLKIEDYDTEEVSPNLMPTYTRDSISFQYPLNVS